MLAYYYWLVATNAVAIVPLQNISREQTQTLRTFPGLLPKMLPHTHSLYMLLAASAGRWKMKPVTRLEIIFRCAIIEALKALRQRKGIKTNDDSLYFAGIFMST